MNVGIDMEPIKRFKLPRTHAFVQRIFTKKEITYAFSRPKPEIHLCGFFCAKEAVRKIKKGKTPLMNQIEILHKENGEPFAKVREMQKTISFKISISHAGKYAVSCAMG